uniref:39S ribosomal protein L41, mitochondrial n=1 Tax=Syphacia muris TaxID=451379 RepID=A0A0N5ADD4_9BILA
MSSLVYFVSVRGVRSLNAFHFPAPWPFVKKGSYGHRKIGPVFYEKWKFPGQNHEFSRVSPKFQKLNLPETHGYTDVQPEGFVDPKTGKFVVVKEMQSEIIAPDLSKFNLKPYVSYRTDAEIKMRLEEYEKKVRTEGSEELADRKVNQDLRWPPPKMNSKTLFDLFYAPKVREMFNEGKYKAVCANVKNVKESDG